MQSIKITRYRDPKAVGWAGYLEPEDRSWIAFIGRDGRPVFFLNRDPVTGAVLGDEDPAGDVVAMREQEAVQGARALHTGVALTVEEIEASGGHLEPGQVVQPLGCGPIGELPDEPS